MLRCFYYTTCSLRLWFWLISDDRPQPKTAGGLMMLEEVGVAGSFIDNSWILFQLMVLMLLRWRKWLVLLLGSCCDDAGGDRDDFFFVSKVRDRSSDASYTATLLHITHRYYWGVENKIIRE
jgi:hypothetical protein